MIPAVWGHVMKFALSALSCIFLGACTTTASLNLIAPQFERFDSPQLNQMAKVNIGDTVLRKGELYNFDAITVASPLSLDGPALMPDFKIPAQTMTAKYDFEEFVFYQGENIIIRDLGIPRAEPRAGICLHKTNSELAKAWIGIGAACVGPSIPRHQIQKTKVEAITAPSFVQEIIYNGRVENSVKFLYREFSGNIARPAFSQQVQYDLDEGEVIGFKQARIRIIEASNTELTFEVLETFPDQ